MSIKRKLNIIYYSAATVLFVWVFVIKLNDGYLLSTSSYGIPYWALYFLVFGVPIYLFVLQIIRHDKWSSRLIVLLIVALICLTAYEQYNFYYSRNVLPNVSGPIPYPTVLELAANYGVLFGVLTLSVVLGPRRG